MSIRILSVLCLMLGIVELAMSCGNTVSLPEHSSGVCLIPSESLALERTAAEDSFLGQGSTLANQLDTGYALPFYTVYEAMEILDDDRLHVWQDVYVLTWDWMAPAMAEALMKDSTFADAASYVEVGIEGLDGAWYVPGGFEYVAYAGNRVVYGTVTGGNYREEYLLPLLEATAALWRE